MKKPEFVRIVGTGGEYRHHTIQNYVRTTPMTRRDAAALLRLYRQTMVRGFVRTLRVVESTQAY